MSARPDRASGWRFRLVFLLAILAVAGGLSALASSSPDGLDSATLRGCAVADVDGAEHLTGQCLAQSARDHDLAASPLADYSIGGVESSGGLAGVIGALITLAAAGAVFWLIARTRPAAPTDSGA